MKRNTLASIATLLGALLLWQVPAAQAQQVEQTGSRYEVNVFGMVCNQCAYGVEQTLLHTDGIEEVYVNLKEGDVRAYLKASEPMLSAERIVQKIKDEGLTVKELSGAFTGRVEQQEGTYYFVLGETRYQLQGAEDGPALDAYVGQEVRLVGAFQDVKGLEGAQEDGLPRFIAARVEQ